MFDQLLDRNERQLRIHKSQIYKQMLDNQILLNQHYRKKRQAPSRGSSQPKKATPTIKTKLPCPKSKTQQSQQTRYNRKMKLPVLEDKETLYKGFSSFLPEGITTPQKHPARERHQRGSEVVANQDSSEEMEEILGQLSTLNREIVKSKHLKHKRLSSFGGSTRRKLPDRERIISIKQHSPTPIHQDQKPEQLEIMPTVLEPPNKINLKREEQQGRTSRQQNKTQEAGRLSLSGKPTLKEEVNPENTAATKWREQREKFIQILRKVKNRGESLFIKLSKYPAANIASQ